MSTVYTNFLDDYIHFITVHSSQLQQIYDVLEKECTFNNCDFESCKCISRHYQREYQQENHIRNDNPLLNFYVSNMDSLHFYLIHLYDCGLRVRRDKYTQNTEEKKEDNNTYTDDTFDAEFARICKAINQRRSITSSFDRFKSTNKFNIDAPQPGMYMFISIVIYASYSGLYCIHTLFI